MIEDLITIKKPDIKEEKIILHREKNRRLFPRDVIRNAALDYLKLQNEDLEDYEMQVFNNSGWIVEQLKLVAFESNATGSIKHAVEILGIAPKNSHPYINSDEIIYHRKKNRKLLKEEDLVRRIKKELKEKGYPEEGFTPILLSGPVYDQLHLYSKKHTGNGDVFFALKKLGFKPKKYRHLEHELMDFFKEELLTSEDLEKLYEKRDIGEHRSIINFLNKFGRKGMNFYERFHDSRFKDRDIERFINSAYPEFYKKHKIKPYDVVFGVPLTSVELEKIITKAYYDGKYVESKNWWESQGRKFGKVAYSVRNEKYNKASKKSEAKFSEKIYHHLNAGIKYSDIADNDSLKKISAILTEKSIYLMMKMLQNAHLDNEDYAKFFPNTITDVHRDFHSKEFESAGKIRYSDMMVSSGNKKILVEIKSGIVDRTIINNIISKYDNRLIYKNNSVDKVLVILNTNDVRQENVDQLKDKGFHVWTKDIVNKYFRQAIDSMGSSNPEFFSTGLYHNSNDFLKINDILSTKIHTLFRPGNKYLNKWVSELLDQSIDKISNNAVYEKPKIIDSQDMKLSDFNSFYPKSWLKILKDIDIDGLVFFDGEATGFNTTGELMVVPGLIYNKGLDNIMHQPIVHTPLLEKDVLLDCCDMMSKAKYLVTFNGPTYDIPFLKRRLGVNMIRFDLPPVIDLQNYMRKLQKLRNYRSHTEQEFERSVIGVTRKNDIHGRAIAEACLNYMFGKDGNIMKSGLFHNKLDLITMVFMYHHFRDQIVKDYKI